MAKVDYEQYRGVLLALGHDPKDVVDEEDIKAGMALIGHNFGKNIDPADLDVMARAALATIGHDPGKNIDPEDLAMLNPGGGGGKSTGGGAKVDYEQYRGVLLALGHDPKGVVDEEDIKAGMALIGHNFGKNIDPADLDVMARAALATIGHDPGKNIDPEDLAMLNTGGAGADTNLPLRILNSPTLQWFRDTKTGRFYAQYTMPGGQSKVLFEAEDEQIQALFGANQPLHFQNFNFTNYLDQPDVFFGGNVAEVEGEGSWENEVKYTISLALDQQDLPDWIKNDQKARDLLWVAVTEDRTDEWFYSQLSKLDSFKQRYPGVQALTGKGLTVLEAVRTHTEYEVKLKTLHAAAGFSADAITPQIVGQVLTKGYSIEDVQNSYGTWKRMNDHAPALAAFNEVLVSQGKNPLTGADLYAFLNGQAPAEIYDIYEAAAVREAATAAGFGDVFSADDALNLALQTQQDLTVDQAYQQFTEVAIQALRFRHELNVNQFGLDIEDLIDLSFGRAPRSGKGPAEIGEAMARITASAQASLQGRVNPYVGFTPEGRPQAQSLGGLRQQQ